MRTGWAALVGAAVLTMMSGGAGAAPSFDCKAAGTVIEKAICADPKLAEADQEVADAYRRLQGLSTAAERERLRAEQRAWIGQRNQCAGPSLTPCLATAMTARARALEEAEPKAVAAVAAMVAAIETDPAGTAARLAELRDGLGKGWTAYLLRFGPRPEPARAEALLREAVGAISDGFASETGLAVDFATDEGFLTALRVLTDDYAMAWPCAVMRSRGKPAWAAVGPLYGSNRDNFGQYPDCDETGALLATPQWKAVEDLLAPLVEAASSRTGTMRYASFRQMGVDLTLSAVDPRLFVGSAPPVAPLLREVAGWSNPRWVSPDWGARLRQAADAAVAAWTPALAARYGIPAPEAKRVAEAVLAAGITSRAALITDNLVLDGDTRLPAWLHGAWTWSAAAEGTPFDAAAGRAAIDATRVCLGTECAGFDVAERGEAVEIPPDAVKALRVTPAPDAGTRAVRLAADSSGNTFDAVPLADGGVLIIGTDTPTVLKRAK